LSKINAIDKSDKKSLQNLQNLYAKSACIWELNGKFDLETNQGACIDSRLSEYVTRSCRFYAKCFYSIRVIISRTSYSNLWRFFFI